MYKYSKKKNWLLFNNHTFNNITETSCNNDTINGICSKTTLEECLVKCENNPNCSYGYYIKDKKLCVPLKESKIKSNPYYKLQLKPSSIHNNITTFIDTNKYKFPPTDSNNIFYLDNVSLLNIETGTLLYTDPFINKDSDIVFKENNDIIIQLLQQPFNYPNGMYTNIKYGDLFNINLPTTNFIVLNITTHFKWINHQITNKQTFFSIHPINDTRQIGDDVLYSDVFILKLMDTQLYIDSTMKLTTIPSKNYTFKFIPKIIVYKCINDKCMPTPFKPNVYKNSKCWDTCNKPPINNKIHFIVILLIIIVLLIILLSCVLKMYRY